MLIYVNLDLILKDGKITDNLEKLNKLAKTNEIFYLAKTGKGLGPIYSQLRKAGCIFSGIRRIYSCDCYVFSEWELDEAIDIDESKANQNTLKPNIRELLESEEL